jgi:hypothetical protein
MMMPAMNRFTKIFLVKNFNSPLKLPLDGSKKFFIILQIPLSLLI